MTTHGMQFAWSLVQLHARAHCMRGIRAHVRGIRAHVRGIRANVRGIRANACVHTHVALAISCFTFQNIITTA